MLTLLLPTSLLASAAANTCEEQLKSCEHVLTLADIAVRKQADVIELQAEQLERYRAAAEAGRAAIAEQEAWYNNKWLWLGLGVLAGGAAVNEVRR